MKTILAILLSIVSFSSSAQVSRVSLQASGLTCSMCSNSINKSLRTLDFVEKVDANIETSTFEITFKPGSKVDFDKLKSKVEDAGFFVSKFVATVNFKNVPVKANEPVVIGDKTFQFVNVKDGALNGEKEIRILNKGFVSSKEYKKKSYASGVGNIYYASI